MLSSSLYQPASSHPTLYHATQSVVPGPAAEAAAATGFHCRPTYFNEIAGRFGCTFKSEKHCSEPSLLFKSQLVCGFDVPWFSACGILSPPEMLPADLVFQRSLFSSRERSLIGLAHVLIPGHRSEAIGIGYSRISSVQESHTTHKVASQAGRAGEGYCLQKQCGHQAPGWHRQFLKLNSCSLWSHTFPSYFGPLQTGTINVLRLLLVHPHHSQ